MVEAKVAGIVSEFELAFNAGSDQGVSIGDLVILYRTVDIEDPETHAPLGTVRRPELRFEINEVHPNLSVGETRDQAPAGLEALVLARTPDAHRKRVTDARTKVDRLHVWVRVGQPVTITPQEESDLPD